MMALTDNNITQTGLRTLFVLQLLMQGAVSKTEIINRISQNSYIKDITPDTVRLDINTLKAAGFDIKIGTKSNNYRYELKLNPIKIKLTTKEIRALNLAKKAVFSFCDFRYIISLYKTFEKISKLIEPKENISEILDFGNFLNFDFELVKELDVHCEHKNEITILYQSPRKGERLIKIRCFELNYSRKNDKLYLWCKSEDYANPSYLRVEKIKKIVKINNVAASIKPKFKTCIYRVKRRFNSPFELFDYERVLKIKSDYVEVKAEYLSDFNLIQRLLSLGDDLIYVDDKEILKNLIDTVKTVRSLYQ